MIHSFRFSSGFLSRVLFIAVLLTVFLVYAPSLNNNFVNWDDDVHLLENRFLSPLNARSIKDIFTTTVNKTYIPLSSLSFALEYKFFGAHPFVYHLNNLLLHLAVVGLVMVLAQRLGLSVMASAVAALLFGIHPLHVESVAWVTERKDVLYSVFYLAAILAHLKFLNSSRRRYVCLSIALGSLSILAKSMALSLPLILLLCDWFYKGKISGRDVLNKGYYAVVMVPVAWMSYVSNAEILKVYSLNDLLIWIWCFNFYLIRFLVPGETALFYDVAYPVNLYNPEYLINLIIFVAVGIGLWMGRRNRLLVFAFLFYLGSIFFVLRFHPSIDVIADRFMYLPSLGWCLWIAVMIERTLKSSQKNFLSFCAILCALTIILYAVIWETQHRILVWKDSVSLWQNQLKSNSKTARWLAYSKLGDAYFENAQTQNALNRLRMDLLKAEEKVANQGYTQEQRRADTEQIRKIISLYRQAIHDKPDYAEPYYNLGRIYQMQGSVATAVQFYETAASLNKNHFKVLLRLGDCYRLLGWHAKAVETYNKAITVNLQNHEILMEVDRIYQAAVESGDHPEFYNNARKQLQSFGKKF